MLYVLYSVCSVYYTHIVLRSYYVLWFRLVCLAMSNNFFFAKFFLTIFYSTNNFDKILIIVQISRDFSH